MTASQESRVKATFTELVCSPRQRLRNMDASRYCVVTLIALLIEAFFSPVWLNSNGLRFDFSPRTRQENPNNNTHTHTNSTSRSFGEKGACRETGAGHHREQTPGHIQTDREMITWLMSIKCGHEVKGRGWPMLDLWGWYLFSGIYGII